MVLVTVFETIGSTYSKAGHRILIAGGGDFQGLVSGGCLEGDLVERARSVIDSGASVAVTYDLRDDADELFGLGVGCNGLLRVLLQPITEATAYEPFASIADCLTSDLISAIATVVISDSEDILPGSTVVMSGSCSHRFGVSGPVAERLEAGCRDAIDRNQARLVDVAPGLSALFAPIVPVPRLLILGAGLDAVPLVAMAGALGWRVTVTDHRPAYIERGDFEAAEQVLLVGPRELDRKVDLARYDAIVVMSHHLATDAQYLATLVEHPTRYVGVLGPRARRERLLADLGDTGRSLATKLRGPVGLDIGADSPESIALSILAEIQQTLAEE